MNHKQIVSLLFLGLMVFCGSMSATPRDKYSKSGVVTYKAIVNGEEEKDMPAMFVEYAMNSVKIWRNSPDVKQLIPGFAHAASYVDYAGRNILFSVNYDDGDAYYAETSFDKLPKVELTEETRKILGYTCKKAKVVINSNQIEIWYTEKAGLQGSPMPTVGEVPGLVLSVIRNGSYETVASDIKINRKKAKANLLPANPGVLVDRNALGDIKREKMVITTRVFDQEQLCWGKEKTPVGEPELGKTYHFAGGTLIVKKVKLPVIPDHYSLFAEITQYSNGDAYDRTGSVFVIPTNREQSFWDGLRDGMNTLPIYYDNDSLDYQGVTLTDNYEPLVELVRFFTPFGIRHFNDRVKIKNVEWEDSTFYKQDVTALKPYLQDEVLVGAFIGNYDKGGHIVSLDIKAYPGSYEWQTENEKKSFSLPLFNTCNVMEMGGQRYGTMFKQDSLTVTFEVPEGAKNLQLRYITTGHGGWGGGDEFNPKTNEIFIDGDCVFNFTPWRTDCATHRKYNPVSGNFWNGESSSDLSRSGWCPGTATNPELIPLPVLKPGKHTLKVAIPLGAPAGNSFSAWSISGILLGEME
ncbi:peptide-N-glycosidase [Marinilabiliaceae bacterium JC017]|nr:peptide-N-glycosidase [Marinilabiliaceae bacterium JC017]